MGDIKVNIITVGAIQSNCYMIENRETKECAIIDPGDETKKILEFISQKNLIPKAIFLTHGHFDHIMAARDIAEKFQIKIYASEQEADITNNANFNVSAMFQIPFVLNPDELLADGESIMVADIPFKVIHTPGHTKGSICFYIEKESILFSGDILFLESCGRTDFPTGDSNQLIISIREKLFALPDDVKVYPGHGSNTTIGHEKKHNPYVNEEGM